MSSTDSKSIGANNTADEKIEQLIAANRLEEADTLLAGRQDAAALYLRGRMAWKRGEKSAAISLYAQSEALDPSGPAALALEQAREIMDFFNKDLYNP